MLLLQGPDEGYPGAGEDPAVEADGDGLFWDGFGAVGDWVLLGLAI